MENQVFAKLGKQYNITGAGTFVHIIYQTLPMFSIVAQGFTAVTMYGVWRGGILANFPWLSLPVFIALLIAGAVVGLYLNYVFLYRSYYRFQNNQQFPPENPVRQDIAGLRREVQERFARIEKALHIEEQKGGD